MVSGAPSGVTFRVFEYGTLMVGEPRHALLRGAKPLGPARTAKGYALVEVRAMAGLVEGGEGDVVGELYEVGYEILRGLDLERDIPALYQRREVRLSDGAVAHAYFLSADQARGLRRVRSGDWRARFAAPKPDVGGRLRWAKPGRS